MNILKLLRNRLLMLLVQQQRSSVDTTIYVFQRAMYNDGEVLYDTATPQAGLLLAQQVHQIAWY